MSCIDLPFQVMSVGIDSEGIDLFPSSDQLIYRIYTDHSLGLLPDENEYVTILSPSPLFSLSLSRLLTLLIISFAAVSSGSILSYQLVLVTSLKAPGALVCVSHNLTLSFLRTTSRVLADSLVTLQLPMRLALATGGPSRLR